MAKSTKGSEKAMRTAIIGMGPVGMILAAHLQKAGCEVAVCDNDKIKINLIRKEGIRLEGTIEMRTTFEHVYGSMDDLAAFEPELVLVCLKTYHTEASVQQLATLDREGCYFVSAQNGIDTEYIMADVLGESKVLRMVINFAGNLRAPNVVKVTFFNPPNYLASVDDSATEVANYQAGKMTQAGLDTRVINSFELIRRSWEKAILNSSLSALCGIGRLTIKEAMEMPNTVEIIEQVIQEAVEVAGAEKIYFEDDFIRKCMRYLKKAGDHFPSLAVDLINNRPTEIDYFNGKIVEYGRKHYIRTSLNLSFTNMVRAMTQKMLKGRMPSRPRQTDWRSAANGARPALAPPCFLGIDLGSAYTKIVVIDNDGQVVHQSTHQTHNRERIAINHVIEALKEEFPIAFSCATGYGRKTFSGSDIVKTEIYCAATALAREHPGAKTILDIGGEDIKSIHCDEEGKVENFYLNDKCAAGTGSFLTEIAERAGIEIAGMSDLASKSNFGKELNSFCTVFAKTEIMKWIFEGVPLEDTAKGIYLSIANRVAKMRLAPGVPVFMIGGVVAHHPYLPKLLEQRLGVEIHTVERPQHQVALGAALLAKSFYLRNEEQQKEPEKEGELT
ncbi:MAG: hypothetical protein Kow0027_01160 [Saprospiraceae bacterium]